MTRARRIEKVSESVARAIVRDVAALEPGDRLPSEASMLERYEVSRGSLREALRILEIQGLITIKPGPGGGPVLLGPDVDGMAKMQSLHFHLMGARYSELLAARVVIEPQIARMAAERTDRAALSVLEPFLLERTDDIVIDEDYLEGASGFHRVMCTLSGNPVLDIIASSLNQIVLSHVKGAMFTDERRYEIGCDHVAIVEAVLDGNGALAEQLMRDHMEKYLPGMSASDQMSFDDVVDWR